ncbi:MAG: TIGR03435 family protein [Limisphaerales bacterium]
MNDDLTLLREFARDNSEAAFAALVSRHVNLVYSVALRQTRAAHLAEEITQAVFIILARKAHSLGDKIILSGWLCRTARYASANALTIQRRRQKREQEAFMQSQIDSGTGFQPVGEIETETWNEISPLLDGAMEKLGQKDHDALVLRFFENKNFTEVGAALGASEDAAKMRVSRALEKLRKFFTKRGVSSTTVIIGGAISANSIQAAPIGLAKTISVVAITKGATASVSTLTLIKGALKIMAWTKTKTAIVVSAGILLAAGTTTVTVKEVQKHHHYSWQVENPGPGLVDSASPQVKIVPTIFSPPGGTLNMGNGTIVGIQQTLNNLLGAAYDVDRYHVVFQTEPPVGNYDFIANLRGGVEANRMALRQLIEKQFHLVGRKEMREADVLVLTLKTRYAPGLQPNTSDSSDIRNQHGAGYWRGFNLTSANVAGRIEIYLKMPVVNRADLPGRFDIDLKWDEQVEGQNPDAFKEALLDQLGLELTPSREPIEMLVVEKTQ